MAAVDLRDYLNPLTVIYDLANEDNEEEKQGILLAARSLSYTFDGEAFVANSRHFPFCQDTEIFRILSVVAERLADKRWRGVNLVCLALTGQQLNILPPGNIPELTDVFGTEQVRV